jgi:hypothetical protein
MECRNLNIGAETETFCAICDNYSHIILQQTKAHIFLLVTFKQTVLKCGYGCFLYRVSLIDSYVNLQGMHPVVFITVYILFSYNCQTHQSI